MRRSEALDPDTPAGQASPRLPDELIGGDRLVFIGGLHRSGTSLVHRCLADHPLIGGLENTGVPEDEGQHLQAVYPTGAVHGGPGVFGFAAEAHLDETSDLVSPENAKRILESWLPYWTTGQTYLVEKSPPNLIRTRFLKALFPGARFVIVMRHPLAVSFATRKWTTWLPALRRFGISNQRLPRLSLDRLLRHWLLCHEAFEADRSALGDDVHVFRYEDFVERPVEVLGRVHDFLGVEDAPLSRAIQTGVNDKYFEEWKVMANGLLSGRYASHLVRRHEARVNRFGYSLERLD